MEDAPDANAADAYFTQHAREFCDPNPRPRSSSLDVHALTDAFLDRKRRADLHPKTMQDYETMIFAFRDDVGYGRLIEDLRPEHFGISRKLRGQDWGVHRLYKFVSAVREMFKWASGPGQLLRFSPPYGDEFELPDKTAFRIRRKQRKESKTGLLLFTAAQIRAQLKAADPTLRAMILLGINCGMGNTDVAQLTYQVVAKSRALIDYARSKTGIERRFFLWPETVTALSKVPRRPAKRDEWGDRVFLTQRGYPWVEGAKDRIGMVYLALLRRLRQHRPGLCFYSLRRTFRTIADELDSRAADLVMGHAVDSDMGGTYVQEIGNERLQAISRHVRKAILGPVNAAPKTAKR
jgi:integrase